MPWNKIIKFQLPFANCICINIMNKNILLIGFPWCGRLQCEKCNELLDCILAKLVAIASSAELLKERTCSSWPSTYHSKIGTIHQLCTLFKCVAINAKIVSSCVGISWYIFILYSAPGLSMNLCYGIFIIFVLIEVAWNSITKYFHLSTYLMHLFLPIVFFFIFYF